MTRGIEVARRYYDEVVGALLSRRWPGLRHAAARLGTGSEVLGLDDEMSRDHDWGLRLTLLVPPDLVDDVSSCLEASLPATHAGLPTRFATTSDPVVRHRVEVASVEGFVHSRLGVDACGGLDVVDWLSLTGQSVLEVTAGPVFVDSDGTLTRVRDALTWYPDQVWRYVVATDWVRLGEDLPLMGRAGQRGDDLGSRLLAARVVSTMTHLSFVLARRWPPYPKWTGTMLARLPGADELVPALAAVLAAPEWQSRQRAVQDALVLLERAQGAAGLPVPAAGVAEPFFDRPFLAVRGEVAELLLGGITDPQVRRLPVGVGSVEQWADNVKVLTNPSRRVRVARAQLEALAAP